MNDFEKLSEKLLKNRDITVYDYYELLHDKNWYENEYSKEFNSVLHYIDIVCFLVCLLTISIAFNISCLVCYIL